MTLKNPAGPDNEFRIFFKSTVFRRYGILRRQFSVGKIQGTDVFYLVYTMLQNFQRLLAFWNQMILYKN